MVETNQKESARVSIFHPVIYINAIIMLVVGSFNTLGQKFLLSPDYGNYKHPVSATICMFYGEFVNYLIFMVLCLIPSQFKKITKEIYDNVNQVTTH